MEKLKGPTFERPGSQVSRRPPAPPQLPTPTDRPPKICDRLTDVEIPKAAWSSWREDGRARFLRRELTVDERSALVRRRDELAPFVRPFTGKAETDRVKIALAGMFGAFRSMRQTGEEAFHVLDGSCAALEGMPVWAIEKACRSIQRNGVYRNGRFDRQWPPSDPELVDAVRKESSIFQGQFDSAIALLSAEVEKPGSR